MGIEILLGNLQVLKVIETHLNSENRKAFDYILQVTKKTASGVNKTIITPPNAAINGDELIVQQNNKQQNIVFQHLLEQTISFARFSYSEMPVMPSGDHN